METRFGSIIIKVCQPLRCYEWDCFNIFPTAILVGNDVAVDVSCVCVCVCVWEIVFHSVQTSEKHGVIKVSMDLRADMLQRVAGEAPAERKRWRTFLPQLTAVN